MYNVYFHLRWIGSATTPEGVGEILLKNQIPRALSNTVVRFCKMSWGSENPEVSYTEGEIGVYWNP